MNRLSFLRRSAWAGLLGALAVAGGLAGCGESEDFYARMPAFLRFTPVSAVPPLNSALNNPGMFCAVTFTSSHYVFTGLDGSVRTYPRTALDAYGKPVCISGFIVGTPALPDMQGGLTCVAYELACPNCDIEASISRALSLTGIASATCGRCGRVYDLNNGGVVSTGTDGHSLYRYRIAYSQTTDVVIVQN